MSSVPIVTLKSEIRERLQRRRLEMSADEFRDGSAKISDRLTNLRDWRRTESVHVFWPLDVRHEPDIRPFIMNLLEIGTRVLLPVVQSFSTDGGKGARLIQSQLTSVEALRQNKWGISEPEPTFVVPSKELDAAIVPALGADLDGFRIGYGMGFYDEFLSGLAVPIICPIFSSCLVQSIPREEHDVRVSILITEDETIEIDRT